MNGSLITKYLSIHEDNIEKAVCSRVVILYHDSLIRLHRIKVRISADEMLTIQMNSWNEVSVVLIEVGAPLVISEGALQ